MKRIYVGVDVGKKGGIFAMDEDRVIILKEAIPLDKDDNVLYQEMYDIFEMIQDSVHLNDEITVIIEDVHSLFGMSAKSNFSFGHIKGVKEAMMVALKYKYKLIPPKTWQKEVWITEDTVLQKSKTKTGKSKKDTKATSLNAAVRIFGDLDFRKNKRSRVAHDGIVDAALMAEYARIIEDFE